jgi:hypothetical protein
MIARMGNEGVRKSEADVTLGGLLQSLAACDRREPGAALGERYRQRKV